jgi:23S rRNA (uracil1939-C5)-methyltransferase
MAQVKIEKWVYGGSGLGRIEGKVALVPLVMPGEEVTIEAVREKTGMLEARATGWIEKSELRLEPSCQYFGRCGGCHYQMAPYAFQLEQKVVIVREMLRRVGKLDAPEEIPLLSGEPWGYRNRSQFHFGKGGLGYMMAGSNKVLDVYECPISAPLINQTLKKLRALRREQGFPRFLKQIELFTNGLGTMVNVLETEQDRRVAKGFFERLASEIPGAGEGALEYESGGEKYRVSHRSFFQVNRFLVEAMVSKAVDGMGGEAALDLYAGVGLFSIPLARRFKSVMAVESDASAARDLEYNAERSGVPVAAERMQAEQYLERASAAPDFVLADPPRAGLGKIVVKHLLRLAPQRITLVSCDPATLARDLAALVAGGYRIEGLSLVDLFPQTYHIETITKLVKG